MVVAALAVFGNPVIAQTVGRPDVKVGDRWQFAVYQTVRNTAPSRTWQVTSVTAAAIEGTENGEPLTLTAELNVLESPRTMESNPRLLDFPLAVGKRWHYASDWVFKPKGSRGRSIAEVVVVAYENVTVAAGEFAAFRLTSTERLGGTSPINSVYAGEITRTYWYAPAARAIVKSVSHNPYLGPSTVELVALALRP